MGPSKQGKRVMGIGGGEVGGEGKEKSLPKADSREGHWCQMAEFRAAGPKNGPVKFLAA